MNKAKKILGIIMVLIMVLTIGGTVVCVDNSFTAYGVETTTDEESVNNTQEDGSDVPKTESNDQQVEKPDEKSGSEKAGTDDKSDRNSNDATLHTEADDASHSGTWENGTQGSGTWEIDSNGVMTISGTGKMPDYGGVTDAPWGNYDLRQEITKVIIQNGITHLSKNMLTRSFNLVKIDATACTTLKDTGTDLFKMSPYGQESGTTNLQEINFKGLSEFTSFGGNAFAGCNAITDIDLSGTKFNQSINNVFGACKNSLETLKLTDCNTISNSLDLHEYKNVNSLELWGTNIRTLRVYGTSDAVIYVPNTITALTIDRNVAKEIHFDGSREEWDAKGITVPSGTKVICNEVCAVTDSDDNMLYRKIGTEYKLARFNTLKEAGTNLGDLYRKTGTDEYEIYSGNLKIRMLDSKYELTSEDAGFSWSYDEQVTITSDGEKCTIKPEETLTSGYMFNISGGDIVFENITIDGNNVCGIADINGNTSSELTLADKALLRKGKATDGGAVKANAGSLVMQNGSRITDCTASGKGSAVYLGNASFEMNGGTIDDCTPSGTDDGAVYVANPRASLTFSGSPKIIDNKFNDNGRNIYVSSYSDNMIEAKADLSSAKIGLYINDDNHSQAGQAFGKTTAQVAGLDGFINDRTPDKNGNSLVGSYSQNKIVWAAVINIRFVQKESSGHLTPLDTSEFPDKIYLFNDDNWKTTQDIVNTYFGQTGSKIPAISERCFYHYIGLGTHDTAEYDALIEKGISGFNLKYDKDNGVYYREGSTGEGKLENNLDTIFFIYSADRPAGSGAIDLRNNASYVLNITDLLDGDDYSSLTSAVERTVVVDNTENKLQYLRAYMEEHGGKFVCDGTSYLVVLGDADKVFRIDGGFTGDITAGTEIKAVISGETPKYLIGNDITEFPKNDDKNNMIKGKLLESDDTTVIFTAEKMIEVSVNKDWGEEPSSDTKTKPITLQFKDGTGMPIAVLESANQDKTWVEVNESMFTVKLTPDPDNNIKWPLTVNVPESAIKVIETEAKGFLNIGIRYNYESEPRTVEVYNKRAVCRIITEEEDEGGDIVEVENLFVSIGDALDFAMEKHAKNPIEMLTDYSMVKSDVKTIPNGYNIKITTATDEAGTVQPPKKITRASGFDDDYMFINGYSNSSLTFENVIVDGGGVSSSKSMILNNGNLTIGAGTTLQNAICTDNGGAIYNSSSGTVTVKGEDVSHPVLIRNNSAVKGGAIYSDSSRDINIYNATFSGNSADRGGAVYNAFSGSINVADIPSSSGTSPESKTVFTNNTAAEDGGALYAEAGNINISVQNGSADLNLNKATHGGGAVYSDSGYVQLGTNVKVHDNGGNGDNITVCGGAVYVKNGEVEIIDADIYDNTAKKGGAVYVEAGSANISGGSLRSNSAIQDGNDTGLGGAVYVDKGTMTINDGSITGNTATNNGSAIFNKTGTVNLHGGLIGRDSTGTEPVGAANTSENGGAIGISSEKDPESGEYVDSPKLDFSGDIRIIGNKKGSEEANVYLDRNSDAAITSKGLTENASVGIYATPASTRGTVGASFGSYNDNDANAAHLDKFKNDREPELSGTAETSDRKIIWSKAISVKIYRWRDFNSAFPTTSQATLVTTVTDYLPSSVNNKVSTIAEDLYSKAGFTTAVFGGAFEGENDPFDKYLTNLKWENGQWNVVYRDGSSDPLDDNEIVIYYSEPYYVSIENNTEWPLELYDKDTFTVLNATVVNKEDTPGSPGSGQTGYGFVVAENGATKEALMPVTEEDLKLDPGESIKLMFPGAKSASMALRLKFIEPTGSTTLEETGKDTITLTSGQLRDLSLNNRKLSGTQGSTYEFIFGGRKKICKIELDNKLTTDPEVMKAAGEIVDYYDNTGDGGKHEYAFASISKAIAFTEKYITNKTAEIQMLEDYLLPSTDLVNISAGYDITLTTAQSGHFTYKTESVDKRATISRDSGNKNSFITAQGNAESETKLNVNKLKFDGRNFAGSGNGGVIWSKYCKVDISDAVFNNFIAGNGGAVFVSFGDEVSNGYSIPNNYDVDPDNPKATLKVSTSVFKNCQSNSTRARQGGGAIWTNARKMELEGCSFDNCSAGDQGGAVFHRLDAQNVTYPDMPYFEISESIINSCTFRNCEAAAAGGIETDAFDVSVDDCHFYDCKGKTRNAGGLNTYYFQSNANVSWGGDKYETKLTVTNSEFKNCTTVKNGGGLRSSADTTRVQNCTFTDCTSVDTGGGISISTNPSNYAEISGCTIENCKSKNGGGVYAVTKVLHVNAYNGKRTSIRNCEATADSGGGLNHSNNDADSSIEVEDTDIESCVAKKNGGGLIAYNVMTAELSNVKVEGCTSDGADRGGGGVYVNSDKATVTVDHTHIKNNTTAGKGGGLLAFGNVTIRNNSEISGNRLTNDTADNAAGVYINNDRTLTIGPAASGKDGTSIKLNYTKNGTNSNLRLPVKSGQNTNSVIVEDDLDGDIYVVNASKQGTQFGTSTIKGPAGFNDKSHVFKADDGSLYGIIDRNDTSETIGKKLIWAGKPVCKITDSDGTLLYFKPVYVDKSETDPDFKDYINPAIFDTVDYTLSTGNNGSAKSAFSLLRADELKLYYENGDPYNGTEYQVKMLVENYTIESRIDTITKSDRSIVFTTESDTSTPDYPYEGMPGTCCTVTRDKDATSFEDMIRAYLDLTLHDIVIDAGYAEASAVPGRGIRILLLKNGANVTLGQNTVLQNSQSKELNGAGVYIADNSTLTIKDNAKIINCKAPSKFGGGVYVGSGSFIMEGGSISECSANTGGGVYIYNGQSTTKKNEMTMSGGKITGNSATAAGGGITFGGKNTKLTLGNSNDPKRTVYIYGNTLGGKACNIQLNQASYDIIEANYLSSDSQIGVYVDPNSNLYGRYPYPDPGGDPNGYGNLMCHFGKFYNTDVDTLRCFVNDYNTAVGGVLSGQQGLPDTMYWVEDFSMLISKEVISSSSVDKGEVFGFTIILSGKYTDEYGRTTYGKDVNGKHGDLNFSNGVSYFTLRSGEKRIATDLPFGIDYEVIENISSERQEYYNECNYPGYKTSGKIGENLTADNVKSRYRSFAEFENKHTTGSRKVVLRKVYANSFSPAANESFTVTRRGSVVVVDGTRLEQLKSDDSGVFWIGVLPYDTYVIEETSVDIGGGKHPKFTIIVDEEGIHNKDKVISREITRD